LKLSFGWKPGAKTIEGEMYFSPIGFGTLPEEFTLKDKFTQPIQTQSHIPSCVAHAISSLIYYRMTRESSRLFTYYNARLIEGSIGKFVGTTIESGIQTLSKWGWCDEANWEYNTNKCNIAPSSSLYVEAEQNKIANAKRLPRDLDVLKTALCSGDPFCLGFLVFEEFEGAEENGVVKLPKDTTSPMGGHAVLAVGYSDSRQCILARNSFGPTWGDEGYLWIPYDYLTTEELSDDFWTF